jgi:hypothetical protein
VLAITQLSTSHMSGGSGARLGAGAVRFAGLTGAGAGAAAVRFAGRIGAGAAAAAGGGGAV